MILSLSLDAVKGKVFFRLICQYSVDSERIRIRFLKNVRNRVHKTEIVPVKIKWIEVYEKDGMPLPPSTAGKKYSGKFHLRVGSELHQALAIRALQT